MDRQPFAMRLRDHLPAYAQPVAALSRITSPLVRALPPDYRVEMHRPGHLTLATHFGAIRIRFDLAAQPALESIALDPEPTRRVALANLYLQPWLDTLQPYLAAYGIDTPTVDDLVPADDRLAVTLGIGVACRLPAAHTDDIAHDAAAHDTPDDEGAFLCIVEAASPALVEVLARNTGDALPADVTLARLEGIPIPTRLRLASRCYKMSTLRSLGHGDVLLGWPWQYVDGAQTEGGADAVSKTTPSIGGHWLWGEAGQRQRRHPVSVEEHCIHIIDRPDMTDDRIDLHHPDTGATHFDFAAPGAHAEVHDGGTPFAPDADGDHADENDAIPPDTALLDGVDLMVHVEIGCVAMPAAELARVRPGYILTLPDKISNAPVNLVVSGRTIATGELVAVGDQLGVRVHRNGPAHG